jgi:tetratricopeptide (TPR) repeat protein
VDLIDDLTRLVDRSLVIVDRGATTRYRMLETIRQYAREKLIEAGEVAALADRHFAAFADLAAAAEGPLRGPAIVDWLDRLDADAENIGAALEWGLESAPWEAVRMSASLLAYWSARVASTDTEAQTMAAIEIARARMVGVAGVDPADQALAARLLGGAAWIWASSGRATIALEWAKDAIVLARTGDDVPATLAALAGLVVSTVFTGGRDVEVLFDEAVELAERSGTWWVLALAAGFGGATVSASDPAAGEALLERAEAAARRSGSPSAIAAVAMAHGRMLGHAGRTDEAAERFGVAIAGSTELGDERFALAARSDLGHALRRGGRLDEAEATYRETIGGWVHLGHRGAVANQLENIAFVAVERSQAERGARLLGAASAIREVAGAKMAFDEVPELERFIERVRAAIPVRDFDAAWAAGRAMTMTEAVALATVS